MSDTEKETKKEIAGNGGMAIEIGTILAPSTGRTEPDDSAKAEFDIKLQKKNDEVEDETVSQLQSVKTVDQSKEEATFISSDLAPLTDDHAQQKIPTNDVSLTSASPLNICNICKDSHNISTLLQCLDCDEQYCDGCSKMHRLQDATKDHILSKTDLMKQSNFPMCEPCNYTDKQIEAIQRCLDCKEFLCEPCVNAHKAQKMSRSHVIEDIVNELKPDIEAVAFCEPCAYSGSEQINATFICFDCNERLCASCTEVHKRLKATREHNIGESKQQKERKECDSCLRNCQSEMALKFCKVCQELLCKGCYTVHRSLKATRDHKVVDVTEEKKAEIKCEPCDYLKKDNNAVDFCSDCKEFLCSDCSNRHRQMRATKTHVLVHAEEAYKCRTVIQSECENCKHDGKSKQAVAFCIDCDPAELMCDDCLNHHKAMKLTRSHTVDFSLEKYKECKRDSDKSTSQRSSASLTTVDTTEVDSVETVNRFKPGKPTINGQQRSDSIRLNWKPPKSFYESFQYQIRYKTTLPSDKWKFYEEQYEESTVILKNLKSDTQFVFQVRMVNNEIEGPYSELSDKISTQQSAANRLKEFSHTLDKIDGELTKSKLILEENRKGRNDSAKTRKFFLGNPKRIHSKEKTIMLVGATGSGKSTLVDGFINYILGVNWDDPYRFTLIDLEEEEKGIVKNQAVSQTQWITTYSINPVEGSRLDYKLNIIDTPGFGDTRGFERDQQIVDQIRQLFSATDETGVVYLDAVCFLTKAPDAHLTPTQKYIFNAILSLFGQDIADNINILITFADGKAPPVLAALKEAKLPHDVYFPFNNSALFADNHGGNLSNLLPMIWEMGCKCFSDFFEHLKFMQTKSLCQTKEVLTLRHQLEITVENLMSLVTNGLNKADEMRSKMRILEQHETEIEANSNFTYTVTEIKQIMKNLPKGQYITNCLICNVTCHKECQIPKGEDLSGCWAMDSNGNCTQCSQKCHWTHHCNTPYIFEYVQEQVTKTYAEKERKYRKAKEEKMTHEKVVDRLTEELDQIEQNILMNMEIVTNCNNILGKIALRLNPLSIKEYIDNFIKGEKQEKRPGFLERISVLQEYKKKCNIGDDVNRFRKSLSDIRNERLC